jgi:hypothetical protein
MLYAEEGDTIVVVFKNALSFAVNMEPAGVLAPPADAVAPGSTVTYTWAVPAAALGAASNLTSRMFLYRWARAGPRAAAAAQAAFLSRSLHPPQSPAQQERSRC